MARAVEPYGINLIITGDIRDISLKLESGSIHCIVCSPPYFGLRDYGTAEWEGGRGDCDHRETDRRNSRSSNGLDGGKSNEHISHVYKSTCLKCGAIRKDAQIGLEKTPQEYVETLVGIFRELWRVLRDDGTVWLNLGDSYAGNNTSNGEGETRNLKTEKFHGGKAHLEQRRVIGNCNLPPKNLLGIPWRVALALQADGWYLRSDIIWCLSGGTYLYTKTQKGVMPTMIKDLIRLKPETVKLWNGEKWTQVLGWSESPRPDKPIEIELRSGEKIGCTPDHQWPTQRGLIKAKDLQVGDVIQSCRLPDSTPGQSPEFIPDDIGWFIGLYLAEGSKGKNNSVIQIASHANEQERFLRLQEIAEAYGGTCRMHKTSANGATINLYGRVLVGIIDQYISGQDSHNKHLSVACWQRTDAFLWQVLSGYLDGDGHYDRRNDRWRLSFARNYNLAQDLRTLCARVGVNIRLKLSQATNQDSTFKSFRGEIRFNKSDHHNVKQDSEIVRIGRSNARKFWDIGVEDNPHLFALGSGVLTHNSKPNPMPESVRDRPTKAHEYIFLLSKKPRYYYDQEAIREPMDTEKRILREYAKGMVKEIGFKRDSSRNDTSGGMTHSQHGSRYSLLERGGRNRRTVWECATRPYKPAHFATFPPDLIRPCILAGCPAKVCADCGAPWVRVVEKKTYTDVRDDPTGKATKQDEQAAARRLWERTKALRANGRNHDNPFGQSKTTGFRPTCTCNAPTVPGIVFDPFMGSGTVGQVAVEEGRNWLGVELNPDYIKLAIDRIEGAKPKPPYKQAELIYG